MIKKKIKLKLETWLLDFLNSNPNLLYRSTNSISEQSKLLASWQTAEYIADKMFDVPVVNSSLEVFDFVQDKIENYGALLEFGVYQ